MYEDGLFKGKPIICSEPDILRSVITGKKSWGLWLDQWTDGICECLFTQQEILSEFKGKGIDIPKSFMIDFENTLEKKKCNRNRKYLLELNKHISLQSNH